VASASPGTAPPAREPGTASAPAHPVLVGRGSARGPGWPPRHVRRDQVGKDGRCRTAARTHRVTAAPYRSRQRPDAGRRPAGLQAHSSPPAPHRRLRLTQDRASRPWSTLRRCPWPPARWPSPSEAPHHRCARRWWALGCHGGSSADAPHAVGRRDEVRGNHRTPPRIRAGHGPGQRRASLDGVFPPLRGPAGQVPPDGVARRTSSPTLTCRGTGRWRPAAAKAFRQRTGSEAVEHARSSVHRRTGVGDHGPGPGRRTADAWRRAPTTDDGICGEHRRSPSTRSWRWRRAEAAVRP